MRAAFLRGPRRLEVEEAVLAATEDLRVVEVIACGVCGSDLHGWTHPDLAVGPKGEPTPGFTGHELAVRITEPATGAPRLATIEPNRLTACGACEGCRSASAWFCRNRSDLPAFGFAEEMLVPEWAVFPMPDGTNPALATLVEPLACAVHSIRASHSATPEGRIDGLSVAVLGAGVTGILTAVAAHHLGAAEVAVTARYAHQSAAAQRMGASTVLDADSPESVDDLRAMRPALVVECVGGAAPTLATAMRVVRPGGEVAVFGLFDEPQVLDTRRANLKELRFFFPITYGMKHGLHDFDVAIEMLTTVDLPFESLITHRFSLGDINAAFATAADKTSAALRVLVEP